MGETNNNNAFVKANNNMYDVNHKKPPSSKNTKLRGPMKMIRVALYMLRNRKGNLKPTGKSALPSATNTALSGLVGSVRPLHLQSSVGDKSPSPRTQPQLSSQSNIMPPVCEQRVVTSSDRFEASPYRPGCISSPMSSSSRTSSGVGGGMSSYASAQSLYDLDTHDEESDEESCDGDAYYDGLEGDEAIDEKAELFIAQFYQQIRLQNQRK